MSSISSVAIGLSGSAGEAKTLSKCFSYRTRVMDLVLQLLFTGIGIGAVYALVALGIVLIFRATNVVNLPR